jgi:capsular polysaccharide biosynthesis protein
MALSFLAAVVSAIVSLVITPKFKSTVVMFPAASSAISKSLLTDAGPYQQDVLRFGEEEESEQLMQVLNSELIKENIIRKYKLANHYELDSADKFLNTKLQQEYKSNIKFRRTEYMSVIIEVLDKDPKMAADIANEISNQIDTVINKMQKERARKALQIVEREYFDLQTGMKKKEDSLAYIMKVGVLDYESQAEVFNGAYAKALAEGKMEGAKKVEQKLHILAKYGSAYVSLRDLLFRETERLSVLGQKYMEAKVDAEQDLPHKFIVDRAYPAEKKSTPIRSLIVLISTISTFFLALLAFVIKDSIKQ